MTSLKKLFILTEEKIVLRRLQAGKAYIVAGKSANKDGNRMNATVVISSFP